ncbi:MAG: hypothetical protein Q9190_001334 [Brigantiaea leucoxantha]
MGASQDIVTTTRKSDESSKARLAYQYSGNGQIGWTTLLPESWLPYVQLARLNPPAGLCLIYFPHIFGMLHAAILRQVSPLELFHTSIMMLGGSFFLSNAIHIWNDLIDAPLDALVERTRYRPIPRQAVSKNAALSFTISQAVAAALFLPLLPSGFLQSLLYALPAILGWTYYPWAKKHTNNPQMVLGLCLAWGVIMGSLAVGVEPFEIGMWGARSMPRVEYSTLCLFLANVLWTILYDTVYAHQDLEDDIKVGIKSLAVLYRDHTKSLLWQLLILMSGLLITYGKLAEMDILYYIVAAGGSSLSLGLMISMVDLKSSESCWWWFSNGFWLTGGSITGGLLLGYIYRETSFTIHGSMGS